MLVRLGIASSREVSLTPRRYDQTLLLELEAEPRTGVGNTRIVRGQVGVRHMVDEPRHADTGGQLVTEFEAFPEQRRRAELFAVRRGAVGKAVLQSAPQTAIGEDAATPPEQVLDQRDPP